MAIKVETIGAGTRSTTPFPQGRVGHAAASDTTFSQEFFSQRQNLTRDDLEKLLEKIDEQGAKLSRTPTFDELREYRTLVQTFVSTVVDQMYSLHTDAGWDRLGRQKVFTTVRKIDRELESMAERIRLGQANQLDIVASQDAIRGMLVDLYM